MTGGAAPVRPILWLAAFAATAVLVAQLPFPARATEEFARRTGKE
jgi:hypothetical protein